MVLAWRHGILRGMSLPLRLALRLCVVLLAGAGWSAVSAQTNPATPPKAAPPAPAPPIQTPPIQTLPEQTIPAQTPPPATQTPAPAPPAAAPAGGPLIPATPPKPQAAPEWPPVEVTVSADLPELPPEPITVELIPPPFEVKPKTKAPLLITVETTWPALVDGKQTTVPLSRTLTIPGPRMAQIRARGTLTESLDADLKKFLAELSAPPQDARFEELWDGWAVVQRNSLQIDLEKTRANVLAAVQDPQGVKAEVVVTGQTAPARTLNYFLSRGITAHLGTGETNYYGSSPARITNIHVGASRFKDRLVEGKVFSFNQVVGPVNLYTGFVTGLVIAGERTANGVGGGICQVSTTVFRTLYGAGLSILERQNHSYQVHYYDPQGLDATIFQPNLDLKFTNDTGGALWFQTDWSDDESRLTISVFGKARDFTVQVDEPKILRSTPSPADRFIPDATLPAGQKKQVDWAAPGAVVQVTRRFLRGDQVFKQDILKSAYRPWPNIYLVGTKN